jgi:proline dehydrogenase
VGIVFQAYLRRTSNDLVELCKINSTDNPINIRLCKGIYVEPEKIAFKGYQEIRDHFLDNLNFMFQNKFYAAIATHDKYLVEQSIMLIEKYNVPKSMYEFQMLFGVTPELRQSIVDRGHTLRVYVPYGKHWFKYSTRRLKENPKIATEIIKALFVRG